MGGKGRTARSMDSLPTIVLDEREEPGDTTAPTDKTVAARAIGSGKDATSLRRSSSESIGTPVPQAGVNGSGQGPERRRVQRSMSVDTAGVAPGSQSAAELEDLAKKKRRKKRKSFIGHILGVHHEDSDERDGGVDPVSLSHLLGPSVAFGKGGVKYVGSPAKLQRKYLKKHHANLSAYDVELLQTHIIHGWYFDCVCGTTGRNYDDGKKMIQCDVCKAWQHCKCNGIAPHNEEMLAKLRTKKVWVCQMCKLGRYKYRGTFWALEKEKQIKQLKKDQETITDRLARRQNQADASEAVDPGDPDSPKKEKEEKEPLEKGEASAVIQTRRSHGKSRSVEFNRKVLVHRKLSRDEKMAARLGACEKVKAVKQSSLHGILREPQEFMPFPNLPTPSDMSESPLPAKRSKFSKAIHMIKH